MKILKRILQGIGVLIGIIIVYCAIITFLPGFEVPQQPLSDVKQPVAQAEADLSSLRKDVSFTVEGTTISAWLFLPEGLSAKVPCIVMGHGFGGTKDMGLERYALPYRDAGYAVLAFDYRHFGQSAGEPRQLIWIPYQLEDWKAAIRYVRGLEEIDPGKIALWGTSFSGGHVIVTAAQDNRLACVVAQCPGVDGHASGEVFVKRVGIGHGLRLLMHGQRDLMRSLFGLSPHKIPIAGKPGTIACLNTPDAYDGYRGQVPDTFINEVCARILIRADKYRPVKEANKVRCPVLLQICEQDTIIPLSAAQETVKELGKSGEAVYYPIGHFDIYREGHFEKALNDQLGFLKRHL